MPAANNPGATASARSLLNEPGSRWRDLELPKAPTPLGSYVEVSQAGSLLFLSGVLPVVNGKLFVTGRLGEDVSLEQGREAVRVAAMNALAAVKEHLGDLDRVKKLVKLTVQLATTEDFVEHAAVADGASDMFVDLFGAGNGHARVVYGVQSMPIRTPVVVETIFEIRQNNQ